MRNGGRALLMSGMLACMLAGEVRGNVEPDLPSWNGAQAGAGEEDVGWIGCDLLLGSISLEEAAHQSQGGQGEVAGASGGNVAQGGPIDGIAEPTAQEIAQGGEEPSAIPKVYWDEYFGSKPGSFLMDPQNLLGEKAHRDRLAFLRINSADSQIDIYLYVFKGDQELPGEVRAEELIERNFTEGKPSVIIYYFMGVPQRTMLYVSPSLADKVTSSDQRRALESSVVKALEKVGENEQLENFLVQLSISIYNRMEPRVTGARVVELHESSPSQAELGDYRPDAAHDWLMLAWARWRGQVLPVLGMLVVIGLGAAYGVRSKLRAAHAFPEFEVEPRLGGGHAAGVGAVISFASSSLPPSAQRVQVPDYLRRM